MINIKNNFIFLIILFSITLCYSCKQNNNKQNVNNKSVDKKKFDSCLLVHIDDNEYSETIKTSSIIPKKWNLIDPKLGSKLDDFSNYFPLKKVFYVDRFFKPKDTTFLILWSYGDITEIGSLPCKYSIFEVDSLLNDSILCFTFNFKSHKLLPNDEFTDTVISYSYGNSILKRTTKIVRIENYGLIQKKNIYDNGTWQKNKSKYNLDSLTIYDFPDVLANFNGDLNKYISKHMVYSKTAENKNISGTVCCELQIDINGKITSSKIIKSVHPILDNTVLKMVNKMPRWIPGQNNGVNVASKIILPIKFQK